jgi:hypothetical protein
MGYHMGVLSTGTCDSLTIICCCQVQNYIYWLISTENDHRHHHKFIKYEKRLRKEGNIWPSMWTRLEHAHCLETINNMWFLGKRETAPRWRKRTLTDSEIKRNRSEVSSKWNKCRIYVGDQLDRCRWMGRTQGIRSAWLLLIGKPSMLPSFLNRFSY